MIIKQTEMQGVYLLTRVTHYDERGSFGRLVDINELTEVGLNANFTQISISGNTKKGTLRGLHSQTGDMAEDKLVMCLRGEIFDVCVDVRDGSPTFGQYISAVLSENNGNGLYIPKGFAHGFITLADDSHIIYFMTQNYQPDKERGFRFDDKFFNIKWPLQPTVISDKDKSWKLL